MIIYYSDIKYFDDDFFASCETFYPKMKKHSLLTSKNKNAKKESVLAWRIVFEFCKGNGELRENAHGKPYFDKGGCFFSISHSDGKVVVAVDNRELGADIQKIKPVSDAVMNRVLSDNEINKCRSSSEKAFCFTKFWTLRESYTKFYGTSIAENLKTLDFSDFADYESFNYGKLFFHSVKRGDYSLSVCSEIKPSKIIFKEIKQTDF